MKKFVAVIAGVSLTLGLSACGTHIESTPASDGVSSEVSEFGEGYSLPSKDEEFADLVRDNTNLEGTDDEFVTLGETICESFDLGADFMDVVSIMTEDGISNYDAGFMIGASVGAYCDEHAYLFQNGDESNG